MTATMLRQDDLTQEDFTGLVFDGPVNPYDKMPGHSIYISQGPGSVMPWHPAYQVINPLLSFEFIYKILKPIQASHKDKPFTIIALGVPPVDFVDYFGCRKQLWETSGKIQWRSFQAGNDIYTIMSKPADSNPDLYHLKMYKNKKEVFFEGHVLHKNVDGSSVVRLQEESSDAAQISHAQIANDMTRNALKSKSVHLTHCKYGQHRSGTVFMSQFDLAHHLDCLPEELKLPEKNDRQKYPKLLGIALKSVRPGLLPASHTSVDIERANDSVALARHFAELPEKHCSMSELVSITAQEEQVVFAELDDLVKKSEEYEEKMRTEAKAADERKAEQERKRAEEKAAQERKRAEAADQERKRVAENAQREKIRAMQLVEKERDRKRAADVKEQQAIEQEKLTAVKNKILPYFNSYLSGVTLFKHHNKRALAVRTALKDAKSIKVILDILENQRNLFEGGKKPVFHLSCLSTRYCLQLKNRPNNLTSSGYYRAVIQSLAEVEKNSRVVPSSQRIALISTGS